MGLNPFAKRPSSQSLANRRRSTRLELAVPIILTGRDVLGRDFREETETITLNLHGARFFSRHPLLVGMLVGIENPRNGLAEKAVCVAVEESPPEKPGNYIAVQLVKPGNIWGLENPPSDWLVIQGMPETMAASPAETAASASAASASLDASIEELQVRANQIVATALGNLRMQSERIMMKVFEDFQVRLNALESAAGERLAEQAEKALAATESSFEDIRREAIESVRAETVQAVNTAVTGLSDRLAEVLTSALRGPSSSSLVPSIPRQPGAKK